MEKMTKLNEELRSILAPAELDQFGKTIAKVLKKELKTSALIEYMLIAKMPTTAVTKVVDLIDKFQEETIPTGNQLSLYMVKDTLANRCSPPFSAISDKVAIRQFILLMQQPGTVVDDFVLYRVGTYSDDTGRIEATDTQEVYRGSFTKDKEPL